MGMWKSSVTLVSLTFALFPCLAWSRGAYQFFQLVQQWPPNFCFNRNPPCSNSQQFTIHGLWPSNYSQVNYQPNCQGQAFDWQMLQNRTMVNQLSRSWPELTSRGNNIFWKEQWDKHGQCSDQTFQQAQYFQRSYEIWQQFDITNVFKNAGLVSNALGRPPRSPTIWNVKDLERRIEAVTHATPALRCRRVQMQFMHRGQPRNRSSRLIFEVSLCYDYGGRNLINCTHTQGRCLGNAYV